MESAVGRGTGFSIYLPRVAEAVTSPATARPPPPARLGGTILLVEDQEALRELIREMLVELGYQVLVAEEPSAALALAREHRGEVHLLLSDVVMPGVSGPELATQVVAVHPGIRVLLMSGYTSEELGRHGADGPGIRILEKPFTQEVLARRLHEALTAPA